MVEPRIFTDTRFPGVAVHNTGTRFEVRAGDVVVDTFYGFEHCDSKQVSESFAGRRAQRYFDVMHAAELRQLDEELAGNSAPEWSGADGSDDRDELGLPRDRETDAFNAPSAQMGVLSPEAILDMWERAQSMPDGPEKEALLKQVRRALSQMESAAEAVANRLLA